jgi:eukaryotic-like serine/threonine-protein kinase
MDETHSTDGESLPLPLAIRVDRACLRFEAAWKAGGRPCVEDVLAAAWGPEREVLLKELILIEVFYRRRGGEHPLAQEYLDRFLTLESAWMGDALSADWSERSAAFVTTADVAKAGADAATEDWPPPLIHPPAPDAFGDYEGLHEVGRGGMGVVYKAWNHRLRRAEALKMIAGAASARDVERFRFEAEAAAAMDHPNIVTVYGVGEIGGRPFLAMKWVAGRTLSAALPSRGGDLRTVIGLLAQSARAVQHAHLRGLLHRDLKPNNVLLGADGQPHVADFGLARRLDASGGLAGEACGTPGYMAPEQARGDRSLTIAVDVYGLGAILYEALTGRPPFRAATLAEVLRQTLEKEPASPRSLAPKVDPDLEAVCLKCLEREPSARYSSAEALAEDLERWLRDEPVSARPPGVWEWARQAWRNRPPPLDYAWPALIWMGVLLLAAHGAVFLVVLLGAAAPWVWTAFLVRTAGMWMVFRRYFMTRFRLLDGRERHTLIICLGHLAAEASLAVVYGPLSPFAPSRQVLAAYPPLMLISGLALFISGSTYWGRLIPVGLAVMALAPVAAWLPEWSPLLYGATAAVCLWWYAYCARKYFVPRGSKREDAAAL